MCGGKATLTKGVLYELHAILTRHQETTVAIDQFGKRLEIPLVKGKFKVLPNNPRRPDGTVHAYSPPEQVDSEIENLLKWLDEYQADDPVIVAAWLHHRFTQIHPYQDGNGRVARVITTLVLMRSELLPLVIDRDLRVEYIGALEAADKGELSSLASLFRLERGAIMQGLSVDVDAEISSAEDTYVCRCRELAQKFNKRRQAKHAELRAVNNVAEALRSVARTQLELAFDQLEEPVSELSRPQININDGGPDYNNGHWYKFEVVQSANAAEKFANFSENHYFVKASMRVDRERLIFVTSFHHVGRELSGIMEATAFSRL